MRAEMMRMPSLSRGAVALVGLFAIAIAARAEEAVPAVFNVREGTLGYTITHKLHEVRGITHDFEGRVVVAPDGSARVQVRAKVASFDSGNSNRDEHMREVTHEVEHPYCTVKGIATGVKLPLDAPRRIILAGTAGSASPSRSQSASPIAEAGCARASRSPSVRMTSRSSVRRSSSSGWRTG